MGAEAPEDAALASHLYSAAEALGDEVNVGDEVEAGGEEAKPSAALEAQADLGAPAIEPAAMPPSNRGRKRRHILWHE